MDDKAAVLADVCTALSGNRSDEAGTILQKRYPFVPLANVGRSYSVRRMLGAFVHDGFIDRYSGQRLVCFPALRLISKRLPDQFPYHRNGRMDVGHFAFWELLPTIDHIMPVSRGGADNETNWATTSMVRNSAKANFTLDELGWSLCPSGDMKECWAGSLIKQTPIALSWMIPICGNGSTRQLNSRFGPDDDDDPCDDADSRSRNS